MQGMVRQHRREIKRAGSDGDRVVQLRRRHRAVQPIAAEQHGGAEREGEQEGAKRMHGLKILWDRWGWRSGRRPIVSGQHRWSRALSAWSMSAATGRHPEPDPGSM